MPIFTKSYIFFNTQSAKKLVLLEEYITGGSDEPTKNNRNTNKVNKRHHVLSSDRKQFPFIFVSYDQSFRLITSDLNLARALFLWQTSQENSLRNVRLYKLYTQAVILERQLLPPG